ncbi:hypothetical protein REH81_05515, partial [Vibrio rotiferianus]
GKSTAFDEEHQSLKSDANYQNCHGVNDYIKLRFTVHTRLSSLINTANTVLKLCSSHKTGHSG